MAFSQNTQGHCWNNASTGKQQQISQFYLYEFCLLYLGYLMFLQSTATISFIWDSYIKWIIMFNKMYEMFKMFKQILVILCDSGWLYGSLNGIVGLFPEEYVRPLARHEIETTSVKVGEVNPDDFRIH